MNPAVSAFGMRNRWKNRTRARMNVASMSALEMIPMWMKNVQSNDMGGESSQGAAAGDRRDSVGGRPMILGLCAVRRRIASEEQRSPADEAVVAAPSTVYILPRTVYAM